MTDKRIAEDGEAVAADVAITDQAQGVQFVQAIDASPLTGVQRHRDGYIAGRVRAARTGVQLYAGSEVGIPDKATVRVYRPLDEVMRMDALGSYKGKPVTDGHPGERVTKDNWDQLARGTVMGVQRDGEAVLLDVTVSAASLIDKLESGEARELSAGYVARIDPTPGTAPDGTAYDAVQRDIYVDHLAVVPRGRAGAEFRVGDVAAEWGAAPITHADEKGAHMADDLQTVVVDGMSVKVTDQGAQAITKLQDALAASQSEVTDAEAEVERLKKANEEKDGEIKAKDKALADATSPQAIADAVKARTVATDAGKKAGLSDEAMASLSDADIRRAVVAKTLGDETAKAMSDDAINGAFAYASKAAPTRTGDAAFDGGVKQPVQDGDWSSIVPMRKEA